ncbi:MAG: hypothetical protein GX131_06780 [candidate division WS1 bacterium]|nr:hypothetical protein [candidate division WS1 bacterium]
MGRIPTWAIMLIGVFLLAGIGAAVFMLMIKPERELLAEVQAKLEEEQGVANQLATAEADLADVQARWLAAQDQLQALRDARSIPISFGHPAGAMVALWYEYREDLPPLIEDWVQSTGLTLESGASFPAPQMVPPSAPPSGFMQVPDGQTINLTVSGTLTQLERLYKSLHEFERVVTISDLVMEPLPGGDRVRSPLNLKFYVLVEAPPAPAAPAGGGPDEGMPDDGMPIDDMPVDDMPDDDPSAGDEME